MISLMIYMMGVVDNISQIACILFFTVLVITAVVGGLLVISQIDNNESFSANMLKMFKISILCLLCTGIISTFLPNGKTIAAMYVVPSIMNNEKIQNITGNGLELLEKYTRQWLEEMTKEAGEK